MAVQEQEGKILILATEHCAYPGANSVGQAHSPYPANTYILRVPAPVLFPETFYLNCFKKGISGLIIMTCGSECPYEGAYQALAKRIDRVYALMKAQDLDLRRHGLQSGFSEGGPGDECLGPGIRTSGLRKGLSG
jgi:F420-non-reducing hydrogenase iron-sulfur subunit